MYRLHISTCVFHRFDLFFTSNSYFDGTSGRCSPEAPTSRDVQRGSDALTAETPRRGGDL
jgi:hypothetical protein